MLYSKTAWNTLKTKKPELSGFLGFVFSVRSHLVVTAGTRARRDKILVITWRLNAMIHLIQIYGNSQKTVNVLPLDRSSKVLIGKIELSAYVLGGNVLLNVLDILTMTATTLARRFTTMLLGILGLLGLLGLSTATVSATSSRSVRTLPFSNDRYHIPHVAYSDILFLETS